MSRLDVASLALAPDGEPDRGALRRALGSDAARRCFAGRARGTTASLDGVVHPNGGVWITADAGGDHVARCVGDVVATRLGARRDPVAVTFAATLVYRVVDPLDIPPLACP